MNDHPTGIILARYHDDELPPPERTVVAQHLATCADCRAELEALRDLSAALASAAPSPAVEPPPAEAFWRELSPQLGAQEVSDGFSWAPGVFLLLLQAVLALFSIAAAFVAALKLLSGVAPITSQLPVTAAGEVLLKATAGALAPFSGSIQPLLIGLSLGVLYLVWLAAWYSGQAAQSITFKRRIV